MEFFENINHSRDLKNVLDTAREEGFEIGYKIGLQIGIEKGRMRRKSMEMKLRDEGMSDDFIMKVTDLTQDDLD
jgi:hypothetical protein